LAVKLRLRRMGKKKQPFYRVVAIDSRVARDGKYIDKIGHYNPIINPPDITIDEEKALLWLGRGAIPTDTVKSLFSKKGILFKWHLLKSGVPQEKIEEEMKKWELLQIERVKRLEALKIQKEREQKKEIKKTEKEEVAVKAEEAPPEEIVVQEATSDEVQAEQSE